MEKWCINMVTVGPDRSDSSTGEWLDFTWKYDSNRPALGITSSSSKSLNQ